MTKKTPYELILGYTPTVYQPTRPSSVMDQLQQIQEHWKTALEALQTA
jgi:hypothetical protein